MLVTVLLVCAGLFAGLVLSLGLPAASLALEPPHSGQIQAMQRNGTLARAIADAEALGNDRTDPALLARMQRRLFDRVLFGDAFPGAQSTFPYPTSVPTQGVVKTFVLLIDFPNSAPGEPAYPATVTRDQIDARMFGSPATGYPTESLHDYYARSSYQTLDIEGTTFAWYHCPRTRDSVAGLPSPVDLSAEQGLIKEALLAADAAGQDFSQYDNNDDGTIDAFNVFWTGPPGEWSTFWWGHKTTFTDETFRLDGKALGAYTWQWSNPTGSETDIDARTVIHEFGHVLGLPDYYDYWSPMGPPQWVSTDFDMMAGDEYDHNAFSKYLLGWIDPSIIEGDVRSVSLGQAETSADAAIIMPAASSHVPFGEFFMVENRQPVGNDIVPLGALSSPVLHGGLAIWHVDSSVSGDSFKWDNSYTPRLFLRLMSARGDDDDAAAQPYTFYRAGGSFSATTTPNSDDYSGQPTLVVVRDVGATGAVMTANIGIAPSPTLSVNGGAQFVNSKAVSVSAAGAPGTEVLGLSSGAATDFKWTGVAAGYRHAVAIREDGTLWAWGLNRYGQLGDGTFVSKSFPVSVGADSDWKSVSACGESTYAIKSNGTLWAWGNDSVGQLGDGKSGMDGTGSPRNAPMQVGSDADWRAVSAGWNYVLAIKMDGSMWAWGEDTFGQLGLGTIVLPNTLDIRWRTTPARVGSSNDWSLAVAGDHQALALKTDGTLWAWGYNGADALGDGTSTSTGTPFEVGTDRDWATAAAGNSTSFAIKTDGTLWGWGTNVNGSLGNGFFNGITPTPSRIGADTDWKHVVAEGSDGYATKTTGSLWGWGENQWGQLMMLTGEPLKDPAQLGTSVDWDVPIAGYGFCGGVTTSGDIQLFGRNTEGELGNGSTLDSPSATSVLRDTIGTAPPGAEVRLADGADGPRTVVVRAFFAGDSLLLSGSVVLDTTAPAGSFTLDDGATQATSRAVTVDSAVTDANGPTRMRFSVDGKASWTGWEAYATAKALTLPGYSGIKIVYGQYRDEAGNVLELSDSIEVILPPDTTAPTISAGGVTEGAWRRASVLVRLTASDSDSDVASITYVLDGTETTVPSALAEVSVPASSNARHSLTFYATDVAANSSDEQTLTFTIDIAGPTTAGQAARGRKGRKTALRYKLADNLSPRVTAVKLVVKTSRGKKVKSFSLGTKKTATWYSVKWKPKAMGAYRYFVYGKDLAGNAQRKVGSAKVVVR